MIGPGKYDAACTVVRESTNAEVAIVLILNGAKGSGFSIQGDIGANASLTVENVAALLEHVAREMRRDAERLTQCGRPHAQRPRTSADGHPPSDGKVKSEEGAPASQGLSPIWQRAH